jgi:type I restriction enzyme S subunit
MTNWVMQIPEGWCLKQIRHVFKIHNGATPKSGDDEYWNGEIAWITPEDLGNNIGKEIAESRRKITNEGYESCGVSLAPAGSIAISIRAPIGHLAKTTIPACVNQGCRLLELKEGNSDYWYYACVAVKPILISRGQGTTFMELPRQSLAAVKIPVPPIDEQLAIARFLDFKTAQIDALIAKKQALLDKLAEKRTALISHAVTKGLDPSAPMKDSGVAWLGEIPAHWSTVPLRRLLTEPLTNGLFKKREHWGSGIKIVNVFNAYIEGDVIDESSLDRVSCDESELNKYSLKHGDFVFVRSSLKLKGIGKSASVLNPSEPLVFECHLVRGCPDITIIEPMFLCYLLNSSTIRQSLVAHSNQVTMATIDQEKFKSLPVTIPSISEQQAIVHYLDQKSAEIDKQSQKVRLVIEKLLEYRSALITNAVTGKIDVRAWQPNQEAA